MTETKDSSRYRDFDLSIWSEGTQYYAKVIDSPAGPSEKVVLRPPFREQSYTELLLRLENAVLRARGHYRGPVSKEEQVLRAFGSEVFNIVFRESPAIASQFTSSLNIILHMPPGIVEGLRVKLRVEPPELARLPWEYVYDDVKRDYLCLLYQSPLVRFLEVAGPTVVAEVNGTLNILAMIANPRGDWELLDTEKERRRIDEAIAPLQRAGKVNFRWVQGDTGEHLLDMMRQAPWHIFHFIGHGGVYSREPEQSGETGSSDEGEGFILLADDQGAPHEVSAVDFSHLLQGSRSLKLAVLNCCESGRGSGTNTFSSPGAALVRSGVPAVVAMQFPISDDSAIRFASGFYKSLADGYPIEKALTSARVAIRLKSDVEWGIPVLFTRSTTEEFFTIGKNQRAVPSAKEQRTTPRDEQQAKQAFARAELQRMFRT